MVAWSVVPLPLMEEAWRRLYARLFKDGRLPMSAGGMPGVGKSMVRSDAVFVAVCPGYARVMLGVCLGYAWEWANKYNHKQLFVRGAMCFKCFRAVWSHS